MSETPQPSGNRKQFFEALRAAHATRRRFNFEDETIQLRTTFLGAEVDFCVSPGEDWRAVLVAQLQDTVEALVDDLEVDDLEVID